MFELRKYAACVAFFAAVGVFPLAAPLALAGDRDGDWKPAWNWAANSQSAHVATLVWNDAIGDGKDRWKTGGATQSVVLPEGAFGGTPWVEGRSSALELGLRGAVVTPDNTASAGADRRDRPYAQYAGAGAFLRSFTRPRQIADGIELQVDDRIGAEVGWRGKPLPLFDVQEAIHGMAGMGGARGNRNHELGSRPLVNLEGRRTWRLRRAGTPDIEFAPFLQGSAGLRENSVRAGADLLMGSSLDARIWGSDPATGAVYPLASEPRPGTHWTVFAGGDLGYIASDALLPGRDRREFVPRVRAGVMVEHGQVGLGFSLNWLGREFDRQPEGQVVGAISLTIRF